MNLAENKGGSQIDEATLKDMVSKLKKNSGVRAYSTHSPLLSSIWQKIGKKEGGTDPKVLLLGILAGVGVAVYAYLYLM